MPKPTPCRSHLERAARLRGFARIAGVDEAGRGCLFGPVFAAAVILAPDRVIQGLADSKQLLPERRSVLAERIRERAVAWAVAAADPFEIDHLNILQASRLAMKRAIERLAVSPDYLLIDACTVDLPVVQESIIHGDAICRSIAAASILAKTARDRALELWDEVFPQYGFARHKGYYTPEHVRALKAHGPTWLHRFSFAPVQSPQLELFADTEMEAMAAHG